MAIPAIRGAAYARASLLINHSQLPAMSTSFRLKKLTGRSSGITVFARHSQAQDISTLIQGIVGRISPKTWAAMEIFLASFASEDYESMASALIEMGATEKNVDAKAFARDLQKILSLIQDLDTEIVVATSRGPNSAAISANVVADENQMNSLFLDLVRVSESSGPRFPKEFGLLIKQLLYFYRYTHLLAPDMNMLQDQWITIVSNQRRIEFSTIISGTLQYC